MFHSGLGAGISGRARGDASPCFSDAAFILEAGRQSNVVIGVMKKVKYERDSWVAREGRPFQEVTFKPQFE